MLPIATTDAVLYSSFCLRTNPDPHLLRNSQRYSVPRKLQISSAQCHASIGMFISLVTCSCESALEARHNCQSLNCSPVNDLDLKREDTARRVTVKHYMPTNRIVQSGQKETRGKGQNTKLSRVAKAKVSDFQAQQNGARRLLHEQHGIIR